MKILVLQLARLGDIYLSWPVLRALKRNYPDAQIHLCARHRFIQACAGLDEIDALWVFHTRELLQPLVEMDDQSEDLARCLELTQEFVGTLRAQNFDLVINLTYSPLSSYLSKSIQRDNSRVRGYTRTEDGFLAFGDEVSAYFYAQAGLERDNRVHVADLFAQSAGVDLIEADWRAPNLYEQDRRLRFDFEIPQNYLLLHPGASQPQKSYDAVKWQTVCRELLKSWPGHIVLIGSEADQLTGQTIEAGVTDPAARKRIVNLIGKTNLIFLFPIFKTAKLLLGADSGPVHIASLTSTPVVNVSFACVRYWETGPRAPGSRILWARDSGGLASDRVVTAALEILLGCESPAGSAVSAIVNDEREIVAIDEVEPSFRWDLIKSVYMGFSPPAIHSRNVRVALLRLLELNYLAYEQIERLKKKPDETAHYGLLDRIDESIRKVGELAPDIAPFVRWYETKKVCLGPMSLDDLIRANLEIHESAHYFLQNWLESDPGFSTVGSAGDSLGKESAHGSEA